MKHGSWVSDVIRTAFCQCGRGMRSTDISESYGRIEMKLGR